MLFFTDWIPSFEDKLFFGQVMIYSIGFNIMVNISIFIREIGIQANLLLIKIYKILCAYLKKNFPWLNASLF